MPVDVLKKFPAVIQLSGRSKVLGLEVLRDEVRDDRQRDPRHQDHRLLQRTRQARPGFKMMAILHSLQHTN